jgi:hypothetical protein|tara:strand:+ start:20411 stop:20821 length:411 start_codon:yes stop_codon:yes gene_type:complete
MIDEIKKVLEPLGFVWKGTPRLSVFEHPATKWYVEFPPAPLGFGTTYIDPSDCSLIITRYGNLRIITPTHSVMDRLIAAASWHEAQSVDQAILVATSQKSEINWTELDLWVVREGIANDREIIEFYKRVDQLKLVR